MTAREYVAEIRRILAARLQPEEAARQIDELKRERKFLDLKNAPDALGISQRQMFRRIKRGLLHVEIVAGVRMVDVSKMSVATR
jgi:hypothetical protein